MLHSGSVGGGVLHGGSVGGGVLRGGSVGGGVLHGGSVGGGVLRGGSVGHQRCEARMHAIPNVSPLVFSPHPLPPAGELMRR